MVDDVGWHADAYVSGLNFNYPDVIRPRCKLFTRRGREQSRGMYIVITKDQRVFSHRRGEH